MINTSLLCPFDAEWPPPRPLRLTLTWTVTWIGPGGCVWWLVKVDIVSFCVSLSAVMSRHVLWRLVTRGRTLSWASLRPDLARQGARQEGIVMWRSGIITHFVLTISPFSWCQFPWLHVMAGPGAPRTSPGVQAARRGHSCNQWRGGHQPGHTCPPCLPRIHKTQGVMIPSD